MAAAALRAQLNTLIASMYATGMVDEYFQELQTMQEEGSEAPGFVAEMVNHFINNTERILNDIAGVLNQPVVNFDMVGILVHQLKGCSSSVGARKVNLSCMHFREFYHARNKEGILMVLALVRIEFDDVRNKFQTMMRLEEQIVACGPM